MVPRPVSASLLILVACVVLMVTWVAVAEAQFTAPASIVAEELGVIDATITASFGIPVTLNADLSNLPPGSGATFTLNPDNVSGVFHWSPSPGMAGSYTAVFSATVNLSTYTRETTIRVAPEGTTALARVEFVWVPPAEGFFDTIFLASDQGGTSTLTVPVSMAYYLNCYPDSRESIESAPSRPRQSGSLQTATATEPTMSWWGKTDGAAYCIFYTYWEEPIDLHVEAISLTSESNLSLILSEATCSGCGYNTELYARDPRVTAPVTAQGQINAPLTINVDSSDPDGDAIASLTADLSDLPLGNDAVFTENADHTHGVLTWTPALADSGDYSVEFRATNQFVAAKTTAIHVRGFDVTAVPGAASPAFSAVVRPNPLGANSKLHLVTTRPGPVRVRLFDPQGRLVREVLAEEGMGAGSHQLPLGDARLGSGVYFYRIDAAEGVLTGRVAVLR